MESNRGSFKKPSSVEWVNVAKGSNPAKLATSASSGTVRELFKKDYVPTEYDEAPLSKPTNFTGTYNELTKRVILSWNAVKPSPQAKDSYGKLGYNVYKNGVLLDWTDNTSYSFETTSPYDTYKVIATYKSYSGIQSSAAKFTLAPYVAPETPDPGTGGGDSGTTPAEPTTNPTQ